MIDIEITKRFNNNIFLPMDIYTINIYIYEDGSKWERAWKKTQLLPGQQREGNGVSTEKEGQYDRGRKGKEKGLCQGILP